MGQQEKTKTAGVDGSLDTKRTIKRLIIGLVVAVIAWCATIITALTPEDLAAKYDLGGIHPDPSVRAGDIFAVSPDSLRTERVCALNLDHNFVETVPIDVGIRNMLSGLTFNSFVAGIWVSLTRPLAGSAHPKTLSALDVEGGALRFKGQMTTLRQDIVSASIPDDCNCSMARRINSRHKLCTVRAALVSDSPGVPTVYSFSSFSNFVPKTEFERCGLEFSQFAQGVGAMECPTAPNLPWDVVLRDVLRVVNLQ